MVQAGDPAPEFTVPEAGGEAYNDLEPFRLSEALGDGPVVLAFVPAAFTSACTEELCTFRDAMARFTALDARVYGLSVDLPFSQNSWIREQGLIGSCVTIFGRFPDFKGLGSRNEWFATARL